MAALAVSLLAGLALWASDSAAHSPLPDLEPNIQVVAPGTTAVVNEVNDAYDPIEGVDHFTFETSSDVFTVGSGTILDQSSGTTVGSQPAKYRATLRSDLGGSARVRLNNLTDTLGQASPSSTASASSDTAVVYWLRIWNVDFNGQRLDDDIIAKPSSHRLVMTEGWRQGNGGDYEINSGDGFRLSGDGEFVDALGNTIGGDEFFACGPDNTGLFVVLVAEELIVSSASSQFGRSAALVNPGQVEGEWLEEPDGIGDELCIRVHSGSDNTNSAITFRWDDGQNGFNNPDLLSNALGITWDHSPVELVHVQQFPTCDITDPDCHGNDLMLYDDDGDGIYDPDDTVYTDVIEPDDGNNIVGLRHVVRTEGWQPNFVIDSWELEGFAEDGDLAPVIVTATGLCQDIIPNNTVLDNDPFYLDAVMGEQCIVFYQAQAGDTIITLQYHDEGAEFDGNEINEPDDSSLNITDPIIKEWSWIGWTEIWQTTVDRATGHFYFPITNGLVEVCLTESNTCDSFVLNGEPGYHDGQKWQHGSLIEEITFTEFDHTLVWDEGLKRFRGEKVFTEVFIGSHIDPASGELLTPPIAGALAVAVVESSRSCSFFTDPSHTEDFGYWNTVPFVDGQVWGVSGVSAENGEVWWDWDDDGEVDANFLILDSDCEETAWVTIFGDYPPVISSAPPFEDESFHINWVTEQVSKQPQWRWAGEEIVLAKRWAASDSLGTCAFAGNLVRYSKQAQGPGQLDTGTPFSLPVLDTSNDVWTFVDEYCVSKAIYESQDQGEVDVKAFLYDFQVCNPTFREVLLTQNTEFDPISTSCDDVDVEDLQNLDVEDLREEDSFRIVNKHAFLVFYLQIEDVDLKIIPGTGGHTNDDVDFDVDSNFDAGDPTSGITDEPDANVSADELLRVVVRGWSVGGTLCNNPARAVDHDNDPNTVEILLPEGRCIWPTDFMALFGNQPGNTVDVLFGPGEASPSDVASCTSDLTDPVTGAVTVDYNGDKVKNNQDIIDCEEDSLVGPKSTVDPHDCKTVGDWVPGVSDLRLKSICPNGEISINDMLMPPLQMTWEITSSSDVGFFKRIYKWDISDFSDGSKPYYGILVPSDPEIPTPVNNGGYLWDTFGYSKVVDDGVYWFYEFLPTSDNSVRPRQVVTYTDNSGMSFVLLNPDWNLDLSGCGTDAFGNPWCDVGDEVGDTEVTVTGQYPYFRKHPPVESNSITKTAIWQGYKRVSVEPVANDPNHTYVVTHLLDRDGFCENSWDGSPNDLEPGVRGEPVNFEISGDGFIRSGALSFFAGAFGKSATVWSGNADDFPGDVLPFANAGAAGECQAYILVEHGTNAEVQVSIDFFEPEGHIVTSVDFPQRQVIWGDIDNDGDVDAVDALKILQWIVGLPVDTDPAIGSNVTLVDGTIQDVVLWGDVDGDGDIDSVDALEILQFIVDGTSDTDPAIGDTVTII